MTEPEAISLAERTNYLNKDIQYLKNVKISEWDIHAAGFSVLKFRKLLPPEILAEWEKLDKHTRTVKEGLLQKQNPNIAKEIIDTLAKVRQAFVILNSTPASSILSIKKDALFLINENPSCPVIKDIFEFRKKNTYTSYLYVNNKEFYYSSEINKLDIKGINDDSKKKQEKYLLKDISELLRASEISTPAAIFDKMKRYRERYLNRELPIETYRDLETGTFRIGNYTLTEISNDLINDIDITQNYINYLLPLFNALL